MRWPRSFGSPHDRRKALRALAAKTSPLIKGTVAVAGALAVLAGGLAALESAFAEHPSRQVRDAPQVGVLGEDRFKLVVSQACDATNRANQRAVRLARHLQGTLRVARGPAAIKGALLRTVDALANGATDVASILESAAPPPAARHAKLLAITALSEDISRLHWYEHKLDLALTPVELSAVIRAAGGMMGAFAADRAVARAGLLAMGGGDCHLSAIATLHPVFLPAWYVSSGLGSHRAISPVAVVHAHKASSILLARRVGDGARTDSRGASKAGRRPRKQGVDDSGTTSTTPVDSSLQNVPMAPAPSGSVGTSTNEVPSVRYEERQGRLGAKTFADYISPADPGNPVEPGVEVQVSCKVYGPSAPGATPDGYWYRIASAPWSDIYYAPANTFMNGDPWNGPYTHNTDFAIPNC